MEQLIEQLKKILGTNFVLYFKSHSFHWNIEGPDFPQYHAFLDDFYNSVWEQTDSIAEHVRALDGYAPTSVGRMLELSAIEEMTAIEFFNYHQQFKKLNPTVGIPAIIDQIGLNKHAHKQIRYFSSGMKQRIKLAQAFFSDTPILLLDEPCTNLDQQGIALYNTLLSEHGKERIIIISSNDQTEYKTCTQVIQLGV